MGQYYVKDIDSNPTEAEVDDLTLLRGDEANPTELTDDQVARLKAAGVKLGSEEPDEIDQLKGEALDQAVADAGLDLPSDAKADDKREALRSAGQTSDGGNS